MTSSGHHCGHGGTMPPLAMSRRNGRNALSTTVAGPSGSGRAASANTTATPRAVIASARWGGEYAGARVEDQDDTVSRTLLYLRAGAPHQPPRVRRASIGEAGQRGDRDLMTCPS